jgi:ribonucleotide reductase alpha subunit
LSTQFSFHLTEDFVLKYKEESPPWGFQDAGSNALGEITFVRTYSRRKEDGTKEKWFEVCQRVIEGMYSIQKDWAKSNRLPWNDRKAQASAQEAYDRMFTLKWTPPGRGLWMMGTNLVMEKKNSAALQNCFTGETRFITRDGIRTLAEANGEEVEVWTASGWEKATVNSFGVQLVQRITFAPFGARSNHRVVETATPDHRWELKDGTVTTTLKINDVVPAQSVRDESPHQDAYIHGLIFADGSINYTYKNGEFSHMMRLCGDKANEVGHFSTIHYQPNCDGDPVVYYRSATNMKALPTTDDPAYISSFINGWAKFDGALQSTGTIMVSTQNHEAADWLIDHAAIGGYTVTGVNTLDNETNFGPRSAPLVRVSLSPIQKFWTVKSIEPLDYPETVYCAVVPKTERFTLASGVYTSNCAFVSTKDIDRNDPGDLFGWTMDALMLGIGVGFDTLGQDKDMEIFNPSSEENVYVVPDTREGWVESLRLILNSYLRQNQMSVTFDYSEVRLAGEPIRGFGGTSSGPEPLMKLHENIRKVIGGRIGEKLDSRAIVDIVNLIGTCVVSGNVRRSATLSLGTPNDKDFINLKNAEIFPERNSFDSENPGWAWMSNNSIAAEIGTKYEDYIDLIADNGEPGFIWLDVTRNWGRTIDPKDGKDYRIMGFNPSLVAGTKLWTDGGIKEIQELEGKDFIVNNIDGKKSEASCWKSGVNKKVYSVNLKGGHHYEATEEHKWPVYRDGQFKKVKTLDLAPGDKLPNLITKEVYPNGENGSRLEGFIIGWNLGDGWITDRSGKPKTNKKDSRQIGFIVAGQSDIDSGINKIITDFLGELGSASTLMNKTEINVNNPKLREMFDRFSVSNKKNGLPNSVWDHTFSDQYRVGLIDGLISSDGSVDMNHKRIVFSSAHKKITEDLSSLLGFFGIKTSIESTSRIMSFLGNPEKEYFRHTLKISGYENVCNFSEIISLTNTDKQNKIDSIVRLGKKKGKDESSFIEVKSVEFSRHADVWDVTVRDTTHAFQLDHCITGNCAEQPLESYELCTLVEVHLNRHEDKADFMRTLKFAYLYGKTVTLLSTHWQQTNAIMQRNRRIGTSLTGIASFADSRGLPELREWMDEGYGKIRHYDNKYSEWLCVRESIRVTTVKPSGSVSILSGATPGVHWGPGGKYFLRAIRFGDSDPLLHLFKAAGYKIEKDVVSSNTQVVYFPISSEHERSEQEVSLFEKIGLAATAQKYWSDNGVSVTLSFDKETETKNVAPALHMYEGQLKAVSFLPMGNQTYPQQPYTQITQAEYESYLGKIMKIDFSAIYDGVDNLEAQGERFCTNDVCVI